MFQRCLYPPACLGAPNTDMAKFYDGKCIEECQDSATRAALVGEDFDLDGCNYECGYDTECDLALAKFADCGSGAFGEEAVF